MDTAGRLHVKDNLMNELRKMDRVVTREYPEADFLKLLVLDATTGQNAVNQARVFDEAVELDGLVLTKLDGTAKGGFVFSLSQELSLPVIFAGVGEKMEDLEFFDSESFKSELDNAVAFYRVAEDDDGKTDAATESVKDKTKPVTVKSYRL